MAARLVQNISDDYLSCPICLQRFSEPRKLPCEHTFCTDCLLRHVENTGVQNNDTLSIKCPLCRTDCSRPLPDGNVSNWVTHFPLDNLIHDLVETLSNHERQLTPEATQRNKCQVHLKLDLNIFCLHHLSLICSKCAEVDHNKGQCRSMLVEDAFNQLKPNIEDLRKQLYTQAFHLEKYSRVDTEFNRQKTVALDGINEIESRLDKFRERCEQQIAIQKSDIERINKGHIEERKEFYSLAARLLESQSKLESLLEASDRKSLLSELSDLTSSVRENEEVLLGLLPATLTGTVCFNVDRDLDKFLNSFSAVGFVDKLSSSSSLDEFKSESDKKLPSSLKSILNRRDKSRAMADTGLGKKFTPKVTFSGKLPSEDKCWLIKIIVLPDTTICVLDKENAMLNRYDNLGKLLSSLLLVDVPYCMALLKPSNDIVITKADKEILEFVTTSTPELSVRKYVPTGKKYIGICQVNGDVMAVSSWSHCCVDLIDGNGWLLTSISENPLTHAPLFEIPDMLCCTNNAEIIVVDKGNRLVSLEQTGKVKWTVHSDNVINSVTFCDNGKVYISCKDAEKICTLQTNSVKKDTVSIVPYNCQAGKVLDIFWMNSQLFVALENGDIKVFDETT